MAQKLPRPGPMDFRESPKGEVRRIRLPRTLVNKGKREARSPQRRKAERVLSWCEAAGGSTMNMLTVGGNSDEDVWQTFGGDPRASCTGRPRPNGLQRPRAGQGAHTRQHRLGRKRGGREPHEDP